MVNTIFTITNIKCFIFLLCVILSLTLVRKATPSQGKAGRLAYFPPGFKNRSEELNEIRLQEAIEFYDRFKNVQNNQDDSYSITIITGNRNENYFMQVLGNLYREYADGPRPRIQVCNYESELTDQLEALKNEMRIVTINGNDTETYSTDNSGRIRKENSDYWKCLRYSSRKGRYVVLFEDDAPPGPEFPAKMKSLVAQLDNKFWIDYVKMYHPNSLRKIPSIPMGISISILIAAIFSYHLYRQGLLKKFFLIYLILNSLVIYSIVRFGFGFEIISDVRYFITGQVYLSNIESCCTPAVLFRTDKIDIITGELSNVVAKVGHAKDHILDESPFVGRATDHNLVIHIGEFSTIRQKKVHISDEEA